MQEFAMLRVSILCTVLTGVLQMTDGITGRDAFAAEPQRKVVVAHRGASAYLPEHTLPAVAMAYATGADFMEQDVVMTRDDELIVWHDLTLDRNTDVAERFPGRARDDGRHYVIDFTLDELRRLRVTEGYSVNEKGEQEAIYPQRFPLWHSSFRVHTLAEQLEMVQGLNRSMQRDVGIYPEIKDPAFHRENGKDLSRALLSALKRFGYESVDDNVYVQTFDHAELKRVHDELFPEMGMALKLVQLIGGEEHAWMLDAQGMAELGQYADGLGPHYSLIIDDDSTRDHVIITDFVRLAHANGMAVHPYTFRADEDQVPAYADDFEHMLKLFYEDAGIDGAFSDFPDRVVQYLQSR
jgi:glycerophosphoryl diester phosphodiesterase